MLQRIDTFSRSVPALRTTGAGSKRHRVSLEWLICGDLKGLLQTVRDRPAGDCRATKTDRAAEIRQAQNREFRRLLAQNPPALYPELLAGMHSIMGE